MPGKDVFKTITTCIQELLPSITDHQINAQMSLKDLGANSIDRVDILLAVTEALAVDIPISEFTGAKTIGEIRDLFENKIKAIA